VTRPARAFLLRLAVSVSLLAGLAVVVEASAVVEALAGLRLEWVAAAIAVSVAQLVVSAWRWRYTAGRLGIDLPLGRAVSEYYLASFLNQVLPGGVLGDVSRAWRHARESSMGATAAGATAGAAAMGATAGAAAMGATAGAAAKTTAATAAPTPLRSVHAVVLERLSGQMVMTLVAALSAAFLGGLRTVASLAAAALAGTFLLRVVGRYGRLPGAASFLGDARHALGGRALSVQLATSLLVVVSYLVVYLLAARAIGVTTPTSTLLPLLAPVLVTMLLPLTIAGWGVREGAAAALWGAVGLTAEDGVAISVAYGLLVLVSTLPGAAVMGLTLWRDRAPGPPADRRPSGRSGSGDGAPRRASRSAEA
jgi:glycosyltransferase 2 family protein